jgi:hypothetical protein
MTSIWKYDGVDLFIAVRSRKSDEPESSRFVPKFTIYDVEKVFVKMGGPIGSAYRGPGCVHCRCHLGFVSFKTYSSLACRSRNSSTACTAIAGISKSRRGRNMRFNFGAKPPLGRGPSEVPGGPGGGTSGPLTPSLNDFAGGRNGWVWFTIPFQAGDRNGWVCQSG